MASLCVNVLLFFVGAVLSQKEKVLLRAQPTIVTNAEEVKEPIQHHNKLEFGGTLSIVVLAVLTVTMVVLLIAAVYSYQRYQRAQDANAFFTPRFDTPQTYGSSCTPKIEYRQAQDLASPNPYRKSTLSPIVDDQYSVSI